MGIDLSFNHLLDKIIKRLTTLGIHTLLHVDEFIQCGKTYYTCHSTYYRQRFNALVSHEWRFDHIDHPPITFKNQPAQQSSTTQH